jgi:hypothetical protein
MNERSLGRSSAGNRSLRIKENFLMTDHCCCPPEAGNVVCELPVQNFQRLPRASNACPVCGRTGKPVQGQTVKALLSVSLREVQDVEYLFCKTQTCPVVYFSSYGDQIFTVEQVRERVYQKEPDSEDVLVCYCFRHKVGVIHAASSEATAIVDDINTGINAGSVLAICETARLMLFGQCARVD